MSTSKAFQWKKDLAQKIQKNRRALWDWQASVASKAPPPFYCSVDLRDSGYKIVPVDSNLYPAGFNNICPDDLRTAPAVIRSQIAAMASRMNRDLPSRILILPESHTSNAYYLENLYYLLLVLREAGFESELGWYGPIPEGFSSPLRLRSATDKELVARPIEIDSNGLLKAGDFKPDWILLNNDFSGGYPKPLDAVVQPIIPSHVLGWHSRKKSEHFIHYNHLAGEFASIVGIDPWSIQIETHEVSPVDFNEDLGTDKVAEITEKVLTRMQSEFSARGISRRPIVFVKNNAGTYGMGVMVVHSADEIRKMNRRTKNKMSVGKNRMAIQSVVVQEGVPTATLVQRLAAEPVIYLVGSELIGGFLRTNTERGVEDNLNSQGMVFKKLCMSDLKRPSDIDDDFEAGDEHSDQSEPVLELVYGSIARLSALASGKELAQHLRSG
ncbi:MAG: glutamate--cysteine ligase [Bdellovibrionales bacterium]|nr:glutamate--cysteine ligase [Bdellovibrionales bacterium]